MVSDADSSDVDSSDATTSAAASPGANAAVPTYDVVYRATRDAMWDVVGTAVLILFHLFLAVVAVTVAWNGLGSILSESPEPVAVGIGALGLLVALFSAYRVYVLATE